MVLSPPGASQVAPLAENLPADAQDVTVAGSIPGLGRSPGGGHDNPLQYSCLENPMDRGVWWAIVHGGHKESDIKKKNKKTKNSLT